MLSVKNEGGMRVETGFFQQVYAMAEIRRALLEDEGIPFLPDGRVDMARCRWQPDRDTLLL